MIPQKQLYAQALEGNQKLYPNPVKDLLHINAAEFVGGVNKISIYNIWGVEVYHPDNITTVDGIITIDISSLPQGVYIMRIAGVFQKIATQVVKH